MTVELMTTPAELRAGARERAGRRAVVMTMGAQDFRSFIISYFISFAVTTMDRIFIGPFVEKLEAWTQRVIIHLAKRSNFVKRIF